MLLWLFAVNPIAWEMQKMYYNIELKIKDGNTKLSILFLDPNLLMGEVWLNLIDI